MPFGACSVLVSSRLTVCSSALIVLQPLWITSIPIAPCRRRLSPWLRTSIIPFTTASIWCWRAVSVAALLSADQRLLKLAARGLP